MANKRAFEDYVNAQANASLMAQDELAEWFENAPDELFGQPELFRDALIEKYTELAYTYGLMSSAAAAEYYTEERAAYSADDGFYPTFADTVNPEQLEKQVRYAMGHFVFPQDVINGG